MDETPTAGQNQPRSQPVQPGSRVAPKQPAQPQNNTRPPADSSQQPPASSNDPPPIGGVIGGGTQPAAAGNNSSGGSKKPAWLKKVLQAVAVVGLLGVLGYGGYALYQRMQPGHQLEQALVNTFTAESLEVSAAFDVQPVADGGDAFSLQGVLQYDQDGLQLSTAVPIDGEELALTLRFVADEEELYLRLENIGVLAELAADFTGGLSGQTSQEVQQTTQLLTTALQEYDGRWIKVGLSDLQQFAQQQESAAYSQEDIDEIKDLFARSNLIVVREELGERQIDGQTATGYSVDPDFEGLKQFIRDLQTTKLGKNISDGDIEETIQNIDEAAKDWEESRNEGELTFEMWIAGGFVKQVVLSGSDEPGTTENIDITLTFGKYGQSFDITAPSDALDFQQLIQTFFLGSFSQGLENGSAGPDVEFETTPTLPSN